MAKSQITFSKREREKQRTQKQQEKQQKMKERKSNKEKGKSLDDMMAYLDEDGNITDKPADPRHKKVFKQEEIVIGVPKQEDLPADVPRTGRVNFFNDNKGFGFINDAVTGERIFFHVNDLLSPVKENDNVTFRVEKSPKGPVALEVTVIKG
ncbi:MAG: cold shock domain-containing protein [Chitinophagaceae bacterium]